jgi:hypothetical protein
LLRTTVTYFLPRHTRDYGLEAITSRMAALNHRIAT